MKYIILFFYFGILQAQAQSGIVALGGNASGENGSISYSVGQVAYNSKSDANFYIIEGVQQPYDAMPLIVLQPSLPKITLYPNPTVNTLNLEMDLVDGAEGYTVYDIGGKVVKEFTKITGTLTSIPMSNLQAGVYILQVTKENKVVRSFKILKN